MDISSLVHTDGDVTEVKTNLVQMKATLTVCAHDYGKLALDNAHEAYLLAMSESPTSKVWPRVIDYQTYSNKAQAALQSCFICTGMLLAAEETSDDDIDEDNTESRISTIESHIPSAYMEAAEARIKMVMSMIPNNATATTRCTPLRNAVTE